MHYIKKNIEDIHDVEVFNKLLNAALSLTHVLYKAWDDRAEDESCAIYSFVEDLEIRIKLTTRVCLVNDRPLFAETATTYIFRKDGERLYHTDPAESYKLFQSTWKIKPLTTSDPGLAEEVGKTPKGSYYLSASPLLGYREDTDKRIDYVYVYDQNAAYASILLGDLPDVNQAPGRDRDVKEGEIGFVLCEGLPLVYPGHYANVIYPLIASPFKKLVTRLYKQKLTGSPRERADAKNHVNFAVGYYQRTQPFLRSYVVNSCNRRILSLIDENSIMWNTDAIYSLRERKDLSIGYNIGQFKVEYEGLMAHKGFNYLTSKRICHRGMNKAYLSDVTLEQYLKEDTEKDAHRLPYRFDYIKKEVISQ